MNKYREILKNWETPFNKTNDEAWQELQAKLSVNTASKGRVVKFSWKPLISVAAAAAVIIAVVLIWPKSELILRETAIGKIETFILPDASVMTLNAGSVASYDSDWSEKRTLHLEGQAFFQVEKGSKFRITTDQGIVEVLGTSFDVFARKNKFRVECHTGKVLVTTDKSKVEITPGNAAELNGQTLVISEFVQSIAGWQKGEFNYEDEPLSNVLDEMRRQFGVEIIAPDLADRRYTGRFDNKDLKQALELVCLPMALKYEMKGENQVVITLINR